jgi:hypothetical protein
MKRFIEGADRGQSTLLSECPDARMPGCLDDGSTRTMQLFVDMLDLAELGLEGVEPAETRRPAYHPSALLKLYVYDYLNRAQWSGRLEREAGCNVELCGCLASSSPISRRLPICGEWPCHPQGCAYFVELCREMGLLVMRP